MADPRAAAVDEAASTAPSRPKQGQPGGAGSSSSSALPAAPSASSSARIRPGLELPGDASRLGSGGQRSWSVLVGERERADRWARFLQGQKRFFMCCGVFHPTSLSAMGDECLYELQFRALFGFVPYYFDR